jgi:hypothetical protein
VIHEAAPAQSLKVVSLMILGEEVTQYVIENLALKVTLKTTIKTSN